MGDMIAMPHTIDGEPHLTVAEAVEHMQCTDGHIRMLLRRGVLKGRLMGKRLWMVNARSADEVKAGLTTRSVGKRHLAKRPASSRKKPAPQKRSPRRK